MIVKAVIEMPMLTRYKYEHKGKHLVIDRVLNLSVPFNYGYVPRTLEEDQDPLDIFVISSSPIHPLTRVPAEVFGVFVCTDQGISDNKLVATLGVPPEAKEILAIQSYLEIYKPGFIVESYEGLQKAAGVYNKARRVYDES